MTRSYMGHDPLETRLWNVLAWLLSEVGRVPYMNESWHNCLSVTQYECVLSDIYGVVMSLV